MNQPNLYHLQYFITAARLGSVALAAQTLNVSQPAVSQGIKKLEEVFECDLMVHSKNRFKITSQGQYLLEKSSELFGVLDHLKNHLHGMKDQVTGPLRIATSSSAAQSMLPVMITELSRKYPEVRPMLSIGTAQEIVSHVKAGRAELGIVIDDGSVRGVEVTLLHEGCFQCVVSSRTTATNLKHDFIATQERPGVEELKKAYQKKFKKVPNIKVEVENWEAIAEMASQGLGIGFIPDFIAESWRGIKTLDALSEIGKKTTYQLMLIHSGKHQLSLQAKAFIAVLESRRS
jgi:LysR family carnitine catabolism transcriptional activator